MYNLAIALFLGVVVTLAVKLAGFSIWAGLVPGSIAFVGSYVLLARRVAQRIQKISTEAQNELQSLPPNPREQKAKIERAVKLLEQGLVYDKWQFLIGPELHAQIAMIKYMTGDLDGAQPHFAKASSRNGMSKAIEGALWFRKKDYAKMGAAFEVAVKASKKEPILWAVYAWCSLQLKDKDKALKILARAVETNPTDEKLKNSLTQLQNDKRLKMKPYEPMWWQFGLEAPPMQMPSGGRQVRFQRR